MKYYTDDQLLQLYSLWSEECYCAGFLSPDEHSVKEFREWLYGYSRDKHTTRKLENYELEFLEEFRRQENESN